MKVKKTRVNSYHNYKHNGTISNEIATGDPENDRKFFLIAHEIPYPEIFPNISLNFYNADKERISLIINNRIQFLHSDYRSEIKKRDITIFNKSGRPVFKSETINYENVYLTNITGDFYDEKGRKQN